MFGKEVNKTEVQPAASEAEQNVCAGTGDTCKGRAARLFARSLRNSDFVAVDKFPRGGRRLRRRSRRQSRLQV